MSKLTWRKAQNSFEGPAVLTVRCNTRSRRLRFLRRLRLKCTPTSRRLMMGSAPVGGATSDLLEDLALETGEGDDADDEDHQRRHRRVPDPVPVGHRMRDDVPFADRDVAADDGVVV